MFLGCKDKMLVLQVNERDVKFLLSFMEVWEMGEEWESGKKK